MFICCMRAVALAVAVSVSSLSSAATLSEQSELLCSPEGLMRLIPQFNVNGQFTIPNPNTDLQTFLSAQQGLSNAIDMILARENMNQDPSNVGSLPSRPLIFAGNWLSSEVGIQTGNFCPPTRQHGDLCLACQSAGKAPNSCRFGVHSENLGLCLFSPLELLSWPSQCLLRRFPVPLLYPRNRNCCVARKA